MQSATLRPSALPPPRKAILAHAEAVGPAGATPSFRLSASAPLKIHLAWRCTPPMKHRALLEPTMGAPRHHPAFSVAVPHGPPARCSSRASCRPGSLRFLSPHSPVEPVHCLTRSMKGRAIRRGSGARRAPSNCSFLRRPRPALRLLPDANKHCGPRNNDHLLARVMPSQIEPGSPAVATTHFHACSAVGRAGSQSQPQRLYHPTDGPNSI
mmetsp:Transcript_16213/g.49291  ORF Transcript_16213/g.49291 Transcript_16213/m.49291 type:complete len:211 (-) Transcript_16213:172-804(-)